MRLPRPHSRRPSLVALATLAVVLAGTAASGIQADVTPPAKRGTPGPTGLTATATQTTLTLSWDPVVGARSYDTFLNGSTQGNTTSTSWTYPGLQCGTSYLLQVDARLPLGRTDKSSLTASTSDCSSPPPSKAPTVSSFSPTSGGVGATVTVSGKGFTGATAVAFNGSAAGFSVGSDTVITTTVPNGATTGPISVTGPGGTGTSSASFTVTSPPPPPNGNANVFVAPPSSAGIGTHGSDSDATNCKRFSLQIATPPSGVGYGCASFQKAYSLAQPGDTVFLNWNGAWPTGTQWIGPSGNKSSSYGCNYPADVSGCIDFTPGPGLTASLTPSGINNLNPALKICADYVELSNVTFNAAFWVDQYGDTLSNRGWAVGAGDNSCQPSGLPPHDVFIKNVVSNGPISVVGGANHVYVLGGAIQNSENLPPQFAGSATVNGVQTPVANHNTIDGVLFNHIWGTDPAHHHMVCLHLDGGSDSIAIRNSRFENCSNGPYASIRVEAEGAVPSHTNLLIENNFIDGGVPVSINCHANNCVLSGITVRFNTIASGGLQLTNDCVLLGYSSCTVLNDVVYGNIVNGNCPSNSGTFAAGWSENYNVWTGSGGTGTICAGDANSAFNATISLVAPGAPSYNDDLATCNQKAANFVTPSKVPGNPAKDILGNARPKSSVLDVGANEAC